jgi:hypothetical protein
MKNTIHKSIFAVTLLLLLFSLQANAKLKEGEVLRYKVTFGNVLKGKAEITFYGKITSYTFAETLTVSVEELREEVGYSILSDSIAEALLSDSSKETEGDSVKKNFIDSLEVIKFDKVDIYYITYETAFIGNIYNLHADIYTKEDFFPLYIETEIQRTGNVSHGKELFFPEQKMAIFSQIIGEENEVDTLRGENKLQDVTTIPFYFMNKNITLGSSFDVSLPQGEFELNAVGTENIEIGEDFEHQVYYNTYKISSEPKGYTLWLTKVEKLPIKVHMDEQKIRMVLKERDIDPSVTAKIFDEKKIKEKLIHLYPNR